MNIVDILQEEGVDYKSTGEHKNVREGWIGLKCPYCGDTEGKYHLGIQLEQTRATCWACGWHDITDILMLLTSRSFSVCKDWVDSLPSVRIQRDQLPVSPGKLKLPKGIGPLEKTHRVYLASRGFNPDKLAEQWGVRGIGFAAKLAWRIFIPITLEGETVSWTTRSLGKRGRYINAAKEEEKFSPNTFLFGEEHCLNTIIIVEGPFDLFKVGYGAVATMGIGYSEKQFERMTKYSERFICFDNEPLAQRRAKILCNNLEECGGTTKNVVLDAKDPGSATTLQINQMRRKLGI